MTKFFECSAKDNTNVEAIFKEAVKLVYLDYCKNRTGNLEPYDINLADNNTSFNESSEEKSEDESKCNFWNCLCLCWK